MPPGPAGQGGSIKYSTSLPAFRPSVKRGTLLRQKLGVGKRLLRRQMGGRGT